MTATRILIGPFRRRVFASGLHALLVDEAGYEVAELEPADDIARHLASERPTVLILERQEDEDPGLYQPSSPSVAVILISQEGAGVQIALRQLAPARLRTAIALADGAAHPRMIALSADQPAQPPFMVPRYRTGAQSPISPVIRWLDLSFARELDRFSVAPGIGDEAQRIRRAILDEADAEDSDPAGGLDRMAKAPIWQRPPFRDLGLDPLELGLIALAAAPDLDQRYAQAIGLLQNDYAQPRPNGSTLARMIDRDLIGADIDALLAGRRLFARFQMIRRPGAAEDARPQPGYAIAPAVLESMRGACRRAGRHWRLQSDSLPSDDALAIRIETLRKAVSHPVVLVSPDAADGAGEVVAAHVACGCPVLRADAAGLIGMTIEAAEARIIDLALRARMHEAALMIDRAGALDDAARVAIDGADLEGLTRGLILTDALAAPAAAGEAIPFMVPRPDASLRSRRWQAAALAHGLSLDRGGAASLAARLRFSLDETAAVARLAAGRRKAGSRSADLDLLSEAARHVSASHAPRTVRRPPCRYDWSDIVLPPAIGAQVRAVPQHVLDGPKVLDEWGYGQRLSYGRGVGALFSGPSGTGKTMSAQIIARALGVDLMQVELSRCVSKYIGETEKNIDACFVAAETASAVLLFDEADALFGKRTEIKDAHDRHANVEVAYLLQRIEAFEGLVILTTNFKANIDQAFLRRLRFVVDFPMPSAEERAEIWARAIPSDAPRAPDLDLSFLARRLELSGGAIQQIAVNAAFAAAGEGGEIGMAHVMAATRAELLKMGMLSAERNLPDLPARPATPQIEERAI